MAFCSVYAPQPGNSKTEKKLETEPAGEGDGKGGLGGWPANLLSSAKWFQPLISRVPISDA